MKNKLLIIGAGGHGKVVADIASLSKKYSEIKFLDDDITKVTCLSYKVEHGVSDVQSYINDYDIFVAIGNSNSRMKLFNELEKIGATIPNLIHPSAIIANDVKMGIGNVFMAGSIINPDVTIGNGVIVNTAASIDHDCVVGNFSHISVGSHLAGNVIVGEGTWVGIGATISNDLKICDNTFIGAGAVIVKDILDSGTYIGVPAKKIK